jgi:Transposase
MVIVGIDAHKRSHTAVAVDDAGRRLGQPTIGTSREDHLALLGWAEQFGPQRSWAIEDCRHLSRRLEADLLAAGESIVRVPSMLMAHARDAARSYGKSDPIDALAVARAALREPDLPTAQLDGPARDVRLLSDHREHLIDERTRVINRSVGICTNSTPATNRPPGHSGGPNTSPPSRLGWPSSTALSPDSPAPRSRTVDDRSWPWLRNSGQPSNSLHRPCSTSAAAPRSPQPRSSARLPMSVASGQDTPSPDPTAPRPCRSGQATSCATGSAEQETDNLTPRFIGSPSPKPTTTNPLVSCSIAAERAATTKPNPFASTSADY